MILLDTHVWIWWATDTGRLSRRVLSAVSEDGEVGVSAISCWEVATLVRKGRYRLKVTPKLWFERLLALPGIRLAPLAPAILIDAAAPEASSPPALPG